MTTKLNIEPRTETYDGVRAHGVTTLAITSDLLPGNVFGLWLPETIAVGEASWCNADEGCLQEWGECGGVFSWQIALNGCEVRCTLQPGRGQGSLIYEHTLWNRADRPVDRFVTATCFHTRSAPDFVAGDGSNVWVRTGGEDGWQTLQAIAGCERLAPGAPFRAYLLAEETDAVKYGGWTAWPECVLPARVDHSLIIMENRDRTGAVGIAAESFSHVFHNGDPGLHCLHSEPLFGENIAPGQKHSHRGVILFSAGDFRAVCEQYEGLAGT